MSYKKLLQNLEELIGEEIPLREKLLWNSFGYTIDRDKLNGLALFQKSIEKIPDDLWDQKSLRFLSLVYTGAESLSDQIGNLSELEELYLGENKFTKLPASIRNLRKLKWLYVFEKNIDGIPDISDLEHLEELVLLNGTNIPDSVRKMTERGLLLKFDD